LAKYNIAVISFFTRVFKCLLLLTLQLFYLALIDVLVFIAAVFLIFIGEKIEMKFFIYFFVITIVIFTCHRTMLTETFTAASGIPSCIQEKIDSIKKLPSWNPPAEINEYEYGERNIYLISANCCDNYSIAVDSNCNYVCAPSGGFTGKGDRKCSDFAVNAKLVRLVWKDERGRK